MIRPRSAQRSAIAIPAVAVAVLCLLPFIYLFASGISFSAVLREFSYPNTFGDLIRTLVLTAAVTAGSFIIGVAGAFVVVRTNIPGRRILTVLLATPLAVPLFVSAYAAYSANLMFAPNLDIVTSTLGATAILTLGLYPYVFLAVVIALRNVDPAQEEVAQSLRTRPARVFMLVTLPQLRTAIASSGLIIALHVVSEYGAMMQTRQRTLTTGIMADMIDYGDYESARSLSLVLAGIAFLIIGLGYLAAGRKAPLSVGSHSPRLPRRAGLGRARIPVFVLTAAIPVSAVGPTLFMTIRGLSSSNEQVMVDWPHVLSSAGVTLEYAALAGLVATLCALPVSWWVSRRPSVWSNLTERSVWLAHSVPNAVLALALVYLASRLVPGLYKTAPVLIIAYVILFLPLAVTNQNVGLQGVLIKYDESAAALGNGPIARFFRITLPIAFPGIATGALLVGLDASKELTTTLMLLPFDTQTLATGLWGTTAGETLDFTAAAPYALMLLLLGSVPVYLIVRRTLRFIP